MNYSHAFSTTGKDFKSAFMAIVEIDFTLSNISKITTKTLSTEVTQENDIKKMFWETIRIFSVNKHALSAISSCNNN